MQKIKKNLQGKDQNNTDNKLNPYAKAVTLDAEGNPISDAANVQQNATQATEANATDATARMQNFLQTSGAFKSINPQALLDAVRDADVEAIQTIFEGVVSDAVQTAMTGSGRISAARIESAITDVKDTILNDTRSDLAETQMFEELPYLNDEAISPVAKEALQGFLKQQNGDVKKAIDNVKTYFNQIASATGAMPKDQGTNNQNQNYNNANEDEQNRANNTDFVALFSNDRQTVDSVNADANIQSPENQNQISPDDLAAAAGS